MSRTVFPQEILQFREFQFESVLKVVLVVNLPEDLFRNLVKLDLKSFLYKESP